jgi:hypothetical protein
MARSANNSHILESHLENIYGIPKTQTTLALLPSKEKGIIGFGE